MRLLMASSDGRRCCAAPVTGMDDGGCCCVAADAAWFVDLWAGGSASGRSALEEFIVWEGLDSWPVDVFFCIAADVSVAAAAAAAMTARDA